MRRHPPHHLSPARANHPAGQDPEARLSRPSHHSNAPIKPESQSILSKIVALTPSAATVHPHIVIFLKGCHSEVRILHTPSGIGWPETSPPLTSQMPTIASFCELTI